MSWDVTRSDSFLELEASSKSLTLMAEMVRVEGNERTYTLQSD